MQNMAGESQQFASAGHLPSLAQCPACGGNQVVLSENLSLPNEEHGSAIRLDLLHTFTLRKNFFRQSSQTHAAPHLAITFSFT